MRTSTDASRPTSERYRAFAEIEAAGMSACYEAWAMGIADDSDVLALIDELPPPRRQPNLVFGSARFHGADVMPYTEFREWIREHWVEVRDTALARATQTNEAARCALHLPVLAGLDGPLALLEVGTSAGLCLYPDRYSYRYSSHPQLDPKHGPASVMIECDAKNSVPVPSALPEVVWRAGIDLNPLDPRDPDDVAWLEALIWPEHDGRRERLRAAAAIAASDPPTIAAGDLNELLPAVAAQAPRDATLVVFHTAVLAYLDPIGRDRFAEQVTRLPGHWLSCEGAGVVPGVDERVDTQHTTSEFVLALDGRQLAWAQPHGRALRWIGAP